MAAVGLLLTSAGYIPDTVARIAPHWLGFVWGGLLAVSSAVAVAGIFWVDQLTGAALEFCGRLGVAGTCLAYSTAVAAGMGDNWGALLAVVVFSAIAFACLWRCWDLLVWWRGVRAVILAQRVSRRGRP